MDKAELRKEVDEITRIFKSVKYYELDFRYIHESSILYETVYNTFDVFIYRIFHSLSVTLILQLSKLFDKREKYSFIKLKHNILHGHEKSELNNYLSKKEVENLFSPVDSEKINPILEKVKKTRDKYYAHLDRERPDFSEIKLYEQDREVLISIAEKLLKTIELKYFDIDIDYKLPLDELGHGIFERLDDWEKYRETYGRGNP